MTQIFKEFIDNYSIFHRDTMSKQFRLSMTRTLQGLGLPTPIHCKKPPFGYYKEGNVLMPIESDLQILHNAMVMCDSPDYFILDVYDWFISAPISRPLAYRSFLYARADRPTFPEITLPIEERIKLVYHRDTASTTEEIAKSA